MKEADGAVGGGGEDVLRVHELEEGNESVRGKNTLPSSPFTHPELVDIALVLHLAGQLGLRADGWELPQGQRIALQKTKKILILETLLKYLGQWTDTTTENFLSLPHLPTIL